MNQDSLLAHLLQLVSDANKELNNDQVDNFLSESIIQLNIQFDNSVSTYHYNVIFLLIYQYARYKNYKSNRQLPFHGNIVSKNTNTGLNLPLSELPLELKAVLKQYIEIIQV